MQKKQQLKTPQHSLQINSDRNRSINRVITQSSNNNNIGLAMTNQTTILLNARKQQPSDSHINLRKRKQKIYTEHSVPSKNMLKKYEQYKQENNQSSDLPSLFPPKNGSINQLQQTISVSVSASISRKDQLLQKLTKKNQLLKQHIYRIQRMQEQTLQQKQKQKLSKNKLHNSFQEAFYAFSTKDSLEKELLNVYRKIRAMQAEIDTVKKSLNRDQKNKIILLKQRLIQISKVHQQLSTKLQSLQKQTKKYEEKLQKLKQGHGGYQQIINQLTVESELLREKEKEMTAVENKRKQKLLKQQEYIKKLQRELVEAGVSMGWLQDIMDKIKAGFKERVKSKDGRESNQSSMSNIINKQLKQKLKDQDKQKQSKQKSMSKLKPNQPSQTLPSPKQYQTLLHQLALLKKSIKQQESQLQHLTHLQKNSSQQYQKSLNLSLQLDEKIKQTQQEIIEIRKLIDPAQLKPKPLPPIQQSVQDRKKVHNQNLVALRKKFYEKKAKRYNESLELSDQQMNQFNQFQQTKKNENQNQNKPQQQKENYLIQQEKKEQIEQNKQISEIDIKQEGQIQQKQQQKQKQQKEIQEQIQGNKQQFEIFGVSDSSPNTLKFSDKKIESQLGGSQNCKITGIRLLLNDNIICGIKATYNYKTEGQFHQFKNNSQNQNVKQISNSPITQQFICIEDQHLISISGTFSNNVLINLTILTNLNRYHKFGNIFDARASSLNKSNKSKNSKSNKQKQKEKQKLQEFQISNGADTYPCYILGCINKIGICQFGAKVGKQDQDQDQSEDDGDGDGDGDDEQN